MNVIDVSTFQGKTKKIDWQQVKASGVRGAMIRAGLRRELDVDFKYNITECNRLDIPCGVYWFSYPQSSAQDVVREAQCCLEAVKPYKLELPIAYDFEYDSDLGHNFTRDQRTAFVYAFCSTIQAAGYYAMLYSNADYLNNKLGDVSPYDLWLAAYDKGKPPAKPPRNCGIWQWGKSKVNGIVGDVDMNETYKDYPAIIRAAGLNHLAEKEPKTAEEKLNEILENLTEWKMGGKQQ